MYLSMRLARSSPKLAVDPVFHPKLTLALDHAEVACVKFSTQTINRPRILLDVVVGTTYLLELFMNSSP